MQKAPDYHSSVYNSFVTSEQLPQAIASITPDSSSVSIAAHSLGNMVVSNAISQFGLAHDNYFMIDAAVPIEAYDETQKIVTSNEGNDSIMTPNMTEVNWAGHDEALFVANWHELFPNSDLRSNITWRNRFSSALTNTYNFYSPGEEVLANSTHPVEVSDVIMEEWVNAFSRRAWLTQEVGKGCTIWLED